MSAWTGPFRVGSPSAAATVAERTQRFRYHSARPSRILTPCTMPSPVNQWYVVGSGVVSGLGPFRREPPAKASGRDPVTGGPETVAPQAAAREGACMDRSP